MRRTVLIGVAAFASALASPPARAEGAGRAVVLKTRANALYDAAISGFQRARGGEVTILDLDGRPERWADLFHDVEQIRPAVVLAVGAKAAVVLRERPPRAPVVYCMVLDPDRQGLAAMPGVPMDVRPVEQLGGFKRVLPTLSRVGVLHDPRRSASFVAESRAAAEGLGLTIVAQDATTSGGVPAALRGIVDRIDAVWIIPDPIVAEGDAFRFLLAETMKRNLPLLAYSDGFVRSGALVAVTPDYEGIGREAARIAFALERRDPPDAIRGRLVVPKLLVHPKTAAALGVTIPPEISREVLR